MIAIKKELTMSEAKTEAGPKATEKKAKKAAIALPHEKKAEKSMWTLEKCLKTARRFSTESEWQKGCPAAYKSATAHGWLAQCTSGMKTSRTARKSA